MARRTGSIVGEFRLAFAADPPKRKEDEEKKCQTVGGDFPRSFLRGSHAVGQRSLP